MTNEDDRSKDAAELRQKAEALARKRTNLPPDVSGPLSPEDILKTLHEHKVYQIELALQNEELRTAQTALEESRAHYFDLYDLAPVGYVTLSEQGQILEANLTAATLLGEKRCTLVKKPFSHFILKEDQDISYRHRQQLFATGEPQECELRLVRPDGGLIWAHLAATAAQAEDGSPGCRLMISDITGRKRAEDALRESEERYHSITDTVTDYIFTSYIEDGKVVKTVHGPGCIAVTGYAAEEFATDPYLWFNMVFPEERDRVKNYASRILTDNIFDPIEHRIRRKDAKVRWVLNTPVPHYDSSDALISYDGLISDITERKLAEEALRRSENLFRKVFEIVPIGFWIADKNGKLIRGNPAGVAIWGAEPNVNQKKYGVFKARRLPSGEEIAPDDWALAHTVNKGETIVDELLEIDTFDGTKKIILNYTAPVLDEMGKVEAAIVVNQDITDRYQAEKALHVAKDEAEAANRAKSEFLANMSHEIRTPINGIMGMMQLLETTTLDADQKQYVKLCTSSANRLTRLLSDILDLSRVEAGKMEIFEAEFMVQELGDSVSDLFTVTARDKNVRLECAIDPEMPAHLIGDEARVRQVLFNLVGNALKFTKQGHVRLEMALLGTGEDDVCNVLFSISDTGIGIPEDKLDGLFKPFVQVDGSYTRSFQGAGLGLAIVKRLVDLMGGKISMKSAVGQGTTVRALLPFKLPAGVSIPGQGVTTGELHQAKQKLRILLAEDEPSNAQPIQLLLQKAGHTVTLAEDGQQALDLLKTQDFDVILMDIQMPVMDGVEATKMIRSQESEVRSQEPETGDSTSNLQVSGFIPQPSRRTPIIALTAYAMLGDREKFLEAGMDDYLAKPVRMEDLEKALERNVREEEA